MATRGHTPSAEGVDRGSVRDIETGSSRSYRRGSPRSRPLNGVTGEGVAVDADGNVFVAEGPASLADAGSAFTKYEVAGN